MNRINNLAIYVDVGVNKLKIYLTVLGAMNPTYYYGELEFTYFEFLSNQLERIVSFDDCKTESISALTTRNGLPHFTYKFDVASSRFVWTRKIKGCPFDIYYGQADMKPSQKAATTFLYVNLLHNLTNHIRQSKHDADKTIYAPLASIVILTCEHNESRLRLDPQCPHVSITILAREAAGTAKLVSLLV